jgi:pimeloyl-ACP methyl ester carboxylesterase
VPAALIQMDHISVQVIGRGTPVILIPGLSSPRAVWDGVAPELAKTHAVYLVQVNGFGGEDPRANLQPGILPGIVADLHKLIGERKLRGAAVVGHSLGGLAGLLLAREHPGDVARLMVVDALPFIGSAFVPGSTVETLKAQAEAFRNQMVSQHGQPRTDGVADAIAATQALKPQSRAKVSAWVRATDMRVSGQALYEDMVTDLRPDMAQITTPITLVYPWSDALPKVRSDAFYRGEYAKAPSVNFVDIGDSQHFIMLDQPEAFRAALMAFLAK